MKKLKILLKIRKNLQKSFKKTKSLTNTSKPKNIQIPQTSLQIHQRP